MKLLRAILLSLLLPSVAVAADATLTGTVLTVDGDPCDGCKVNVTSPTTQTVDGIVIPKGLQFSFKTTSSGQVPAGQTLIQNSVIQLEVAGDLKAQVKVPAQATVDMSELIANVYTQSGVSHVDCEGTGKALQFDILSGSFMCVDFSAGGSPSFVTMQPSTGTAPVADSPSDTLILTAGTALTVTGDGTSDAVTFAVAPLGVTGAEIANATIGVGKLSATGTPSSTTFLRGDNSWSAAGTAIPPNSCSANQYANSIDATGTLACAQVGFAQLSGTATDAQIPNDITVDFATAAGTATSATSATTATALATNPTDCATDQYANAIVANGDLTCAQVNFSQLAGTATAAQVPLASTATALATNPSDCTSGEFANAIAANGDLTCATPAGGGASLLGVTDVLSGGTLLARTFANGAGTVVRVEVFPETTIKTDEGAAATPGTIAWAEAQLTGGGEIYLHAGTYNVGTTITMDVAGTTLRCEDPQTSILNAKTNLNSTILNVGWAGAQRQGMQVIGCGFNGNGANQSTSGTLIALKDTADSRIKGNYFRYWKSKGMTIGCSIGATGAPQCLEQMIMQNLFFSSGAAAGSAGSAIEIVADAGKPLTDSHIMYNDIGGANNDGNNTSAWIKIGSGTANGTNGWSIQGNHVYGWDRGPCIEIADPSANLLDIQNNTLESCTGALKWTGDSGSSAGWSLIQNNKMYGYSRQCSVVGAGSYLGKRCSSNADCGTGGTCNVTGPVVFDLNRSLRNTIVGNLFQSQQGGVTTFIQLRDSGAFGGSNHNLIANNTIDFNVAAEKGITFANSSSNNVVSGNRCRGIGGGGGGTCIDGGTISNNQFYSNVCNNICTALETNMPTYANQVHDLNTNVGDVGDFTCATGAAPCTIDSGAIADADLASNYSGVGACGANTWASTLNDNAAPTCTQPAFSNLSGAATDAQIPDSITVDQATTAIAFATDPGDCAANQYAHTIAQNGVLNCSQVSYSQLSGNQITLAGDGARLTFDPDSSNLQDFLVFTDGTETIGSFYTALKYAAGTYTLNTNTAGLFGFNMPNTTVLSYTAASNPVFSSIANLFNGSPKIQIANGVASQGTFAAPFAAAVTFEASGAGTVANILAPGADFSSTPTYSVAAGGTFNSGSDRYGFYHKPTVNTGATILADRGLYIANKTGSGTLTFQMGIEIENFPGATMQIGLRNGSTTFWAPTNGADPGDAFSVTPNRTMIAFSPTGAARTSSTTTAIADGIQDGQIFIIKNVGTANALTIKNNANTDFGASDCVLQRGGVLQVTWDPGESNWLLMSCAAN